MKFRLFCVLLACFTLTGCVIDDGPANFPAGEVEGYRAIYASDTDLNITYKEKAPIKNPGKIYSYSTYLLLVDNGEGIHVFDNTDRTNPNQIGFIQIKGSRDVAMNENAIFVDQFSDLVVIDISDIQAPVVSSRVESIYPNGELLSPRGHYFECPDPARADLITAWQLTTLHNPECYR